MIDEKRIAQIMKSLDCSREEAIEVLQDDEDVDHGVKKDWDLSEAEHKKAMKQANAGTRKSSKSGETRRKPKENPTKEGIISEIHAFLCEKEYENCEITNKTREISFHFGDKDYTVTLIEKRKPKN